MEVLVVFKQLIILLRFAWFLNELGNAMLLQESEKVNIDRDVEQHIEILMNYMKDPASEIVNIRKDL